ncbi:hypothetical protein NM208_g3366 [Fusarium decemcellulare]|uniref:Uncharacterized protein n=1 Tax=Fusarium decemcellulare TaxID=57161 RepID=A0ACC1SPC2_9HYPO|nr:hypothetical protein NM208_g3366 [Fusarium decemcellulare]
MLLSCTLSAAARAGKVHLGPQITSSGSLEDLELVKGHHRTCLNQHTGACQQTLSGESIDDRQGTPLPTRILDISQGDLSAGSSAKAPPKTTTKNLPDRLEGVGLAFYDLSKTFQEAITVTRHLGLRYLWIDSLCILRDSSDDWAKEEHTMCDVYSHAQVVIAAFSAPNAYSGLFQTYPLLPSTVLPYFDASGSPAGTIEAVMLPWTTSTLNRSEDKGELATRGWSLQEGILARRIVYFTDQSVVWQCAEAHLDELRRFYRHDFREWTLQEQFDKIVNRYSDRKLTYMSDKPVALQGITTAFEKARREAGYFGCWKEDPFEDLHWERDPPTVPASS